MSNIQKLLEEGTRLYLQNNYHEALHIFEKLSLLSKDNPVVLNNIGICFMSLGNTKRAMKYFEKALKINPDAVEPNYNIANLNYNSENYSKAIIYYKLVLNKVRGDEIYLNLATSLAKVNIYEESEKYFRIYLKTKPHDEGALSNLGVVLSRQGKFDESIRLYKKALKIKPEYWDAMYNIGILYSRKRNYEKAVQIFEKLIQKNPKHSKALSHLVNRSPYILDWKRHKKYAPLLDKITKEELAKGLIPGEQPFMSVIRTDNPKINFEISKSYSEGYSDQTSFDKQNLEYPHHKRKKGKLTIGYVSDGFRDFPTGHNLVRVLELHNNIINVNTYSHGPDDQSAWLARTKKTTTFVDIRNLSDLEAAKRILKDKVDILIDLKGHTKDGRLGIFALKPAPIAISWLGYPGTTGSKFIDYIIADKIVIPKGTRRYYSEKIIYMPDTYRPTDDAAEISFIPFTRKDVGLPNNSFVFASFNSPYKLDPIMFDIWMRILKQVPNSVLWQMMDKVNIQKKFLAETTKRGINPKRIIFADKIVKEAHLARMQLADLALDTRIVNGHTTTVDALWANLPVLTLKGKHFCSRVSASVLNSIDLKQLIARNLKEYEQIAVAIASTPSRAKQLTNKILNNKKTFPLFDTEKFTKNLEDGYKTVWEIYKENQKPKNIYV